jgi:hypothetical protein
MFRLRVVYAAVLLEHMRVAPKKFADDRSQRVVYGEQSAFGRYLRQKYPLEHVVADLLAQFVHVAALDRIDHFVRFLEDEMGEGRERLLAIPRTTVRRPQRPHDVNQFLECFACLSHQPPFASSWFPCFVPSCLRAFVVCLCGLPSCLRGFAVRVFVVSWLDGNIRGLHA